MSYSIKDFKRQLADGLLDKNPVLAQMLGMCSTLAVTTSIANAVGMGLAVTAVLVCSNVFISLLRKIIPQQIRIASYIVIISGFVTAVQLLIQAFLPELDRTLGLFIPLIVVNCIILARAESFASKNPVLPSAVDGVVMGIGYTDALILLAAIRELLGAGTLLGYRVMPDSFEPAIIFILPSGAFLTLGFLIAAANFIAEKRSQRAAKAVAADNDGTDNASTGNAGTDNASTDNTGIDNAGIDNTSTDNAGIDNVNIDNESGEEGDK